MTGLFAAGIVVGGFAVTQNFAPDAVAQASASKQIVDAAKANLQVGETIDGYLAIIDEGVSADIRAAVNEINIRRKSVYTQLARDKGTSPENVAAVSGEKLVAKAKAGEKVKLSDGQWHLVN